MMQNQIDRFSLNSILCSVIISFIFAGFTGGCSSTPKNTIAAQQAAKSVYEKQKPIPIQNSQTDNRPDWTKKTTYEDSESGMIYFSGGFLNGSDYSVAMRCANAEALKVAIQTISQYVRAEFSSYVQGPNTGAGGVVDRYVEDGISTFTQNLHTQGIRQKEVYYEEMFSPSVMQSTYNVWIQLEMSMSDYLRAKSDAIRKLHNEFSRNGENAAKEKADQLLEQLKKEIERKTNYGA
ncbi:hypothetical protein ACFL6B_03730 [Thermodesulfobacteriota bacterium]